ncbi:MULTISPECIES: invasion associated locus B family protein [Bradyrhizobium]|uniref:invasion associated locus B family protein n=1 Tax=Bradyrhizobium TaxID=374 RepID=UPI001B8A7671|nr:MULTISPECIES: invasion associated locus B family protein [Bradyrhizobium]MBR0973125.1 invasion associated locus B family protein [Bradyrhizobium japonicum]
MIDTASTPWPRPARACLSILFAAAITGPASVLSAAAAQQQARQAKPAEIAPRGQREAKDITFGDWQKLCFKPGGARALCRTSITGKFPTGQTAVRVDLIERDGDRAARLQVFVPVGMYLKQPAKLTVDQGSEQLLPYNWCLTNACIAADVVDHSFVTAMESGKALVLVVVDSSLLAVTTSLPLTQFASVHKGAAAKTFEQDIDE